MSTPRTVVVTATTNPNRAAACMASWGPVPKVVVLNGPKAAVSTTWQHHVGGVTTVTPTGKDTDPSKPVPPDYLGTVPAFKAGTEVALEMGAEIIACLHDDLRIDDPHWVQQVEDRFDREPQVGLLGFGGAIGLGADNIYQVPYQPMQLARIGFRSNLVDAEVHGTRSLLAERVACLDGFSQIGRREFWEGQSPNTRIAHPEPFRPWHVLADLGMIHHFYDGALGCLAARYGWQVYYLPIRGQHYGGQTAVGDQGYQQWANARTQGGDHGFWEQAHKSGYDAFKDVLPIRI